MKCAACAMHTRPYLQLKGLAELGDLLGVVAAHLQDVLLISKLVLLHLLPQPPLIPVQLLLPPACLVLLQLERVLCVGLEQRRVVLVLVQQVLDLLLVHFDLDLVPFLHLLHFAVLVAQLCLAVLQLLFGDLPKRVDLVLHRAGGCGSTGCVASRTAGSGEGLRRARTRSSCM